MRISPSSLSSSGRRFGFSLLFTCHLVFLSSFLDKGREKNFEELVLSFFLLKQTGVSGLCFWELGEELEEAAVLCWVVGFSF